jgi:hypothetical protein
MRTTLPTIALFIASLTSQTFAAESAQWIDRNPEASFAYSPPEAPHRHSSTYQEGVQRGYATVLQAQANYRLQDAQAAIFDEQAYSMHLDNALKLTSVQFERKQIISDYFHNKRIERIVRREQLRQLKSIEELREALDYTLTEYDVDFTTGTVYWPALVAGPKYAEYRKSLDRLASKVLTGEATTEDREEFVTVCNKFRHQLTQDREVDVEKDSPSLQAEYEAVSRLLKGLKMAPVVMAQAPIETFSMR